MSDLYTYVMTHDSGLAPNPFGGFCTLAVCTPNHQGSKAGPGDWIAGVSRKSRGHELIYAMEVAERLHMNAHFKDPRFEEKKPVLAGGPEQRCGDNIYGQDEVGRWFQLDNPYHVGEADLRKDTRKPWVFAATEFWYLGREAVSVPQEYRVLFGGRGARVTHPPELVAAFKAWVRSTLPKGRYGRPRDLERADCDSCGDRPLTPPRQCTRC